MEVNKQIQKLNRISLSIESAIKKDIESVVDWMNTEFDIYERGTNNTVSKNKLLKGIFDLFEFVEKRHCCAITRTGVRCSKTSINNSVYCKAHLQLQSRNLEPKQHENKLFLFEPEKTQTQKEPKNCKKILIDNSNYYMDSEFIYDIETFDKVGYIDNGKSILTDDPFVLRKMTQI